MYVMKLLKETSDETKKGVILKIEANNKLLSSNNCLYYQLQYEKYTEIKILIDSNEAQL